MKYIKMISKILLYILIYGGTYYLIFIPASIIKGIKIPFNGSSWPIIPDYAIISCILTIIIYFLIFLWKRENLFIYCQFSKLKLTDFILLLCIAFSFKLLDNYSKYNFLKQDPLLITSLIESVPIIRRLILFFYLGIAVPFTEEILNRGLIFNELKKNMPVMLAILIQGILFAVGHSGIGMMYSFFYGILFVLVYLWTKSIWSPVLIHSFCNSVEILAPRIFNLTIKYNYFILFLSSIIFFTACYYLWRQKGRYS